MDYRDERDALRARVENLEQQLDDAKREAQDYQDGAHAARVAQIKEQIDEAAALIRRIRGGLSEIGGLGGAPPRRSMAPLLLAVVVLVLLGAGVAGLLLVRTGPRSAPVPVGAAPATAVAVGFGDTPGPAKVPMPGPAADYFADATSVPGLFKAKIGGPVRVLELVIYSGYVIAKVQDPKKHDNVDRYTLRDGVVGDGEPVRLFGNMKTAKDVDDAVQDLAPIDFALVPKMVADAKAEVAIDDGKVSHVMLDASRVFQKETLWRVYVSSPRKSGFVEFDTAGRVRKVNR